MNDDLDFLSAPQCPACDGDGYYMGSLGRLAWCRCQQCGAQFSLSEEE